MSLLWIPLPQQNAYWSTRLLILDDGFQIGFFHNMCPNFSGTGFSGIGLTGIGFSGTGLSRTGLSGTCFSGTSFSVPLVISKFLTSFKD